MEADVLWSFIVHCATDKSGGKSLNFVASFKMLQPFAYLIGVTFILICFWKTASLSVDFSICNGFSENNSNNSKKFLEKKGGASEVRISDAKSSSSTKIAVFFKSLGPSF
jgi:hypothetical protein